MLWLATNCCVLFAINGLPLSDKTIWGQPLREMNLIKLLVNVWDDASGTKSDAIRLVAAHVYITM